VHRTRHQVCGRLIGRGSWLPGIALTAGCLSLAMMVLIGLLGPSAAVARIPADLPWPSWFILVRPSLELVSKLMWLTVGLGAVSLVAGLAAVRRGWRPRPRLLVLGSVVAVALLTVLPPMGSADMLDYAVFGRIAALGHSPYIMTPGQLKASGDPIGAIAVPGYQDQPSRYGPVATGTQELASRLAGTSAARNIFWLKFWNSIGYLTLVLLFDRLFRSQRTQRVRAHLLWSVNPLMLWTVMAGGHNDGLAVSLGASALFAVRKLAPCRALLAGLLIGLATAVKAPFVLFGSGVIWAARRSPTALTAAGAGVAAILLPAYLMAGSASIEATMRVATMVPVGYTPWFVAARLMHLAHVAVSINALGLAGFLVMVAILTWRLPSGPPGLPAIRPALAVSLAWLLTSPQQHPWYFTMIFPLIAAMYASRLDWIVTVCVAASSLAALPRLYAPGDLRLAPLVALVREVDVVFVPAALTVATFALLWLCFTRNWKIEVRGMVLDPSGLYVELPFSGTRS
jgi:alpha-1,6-mannosyltransferase